MTENTTETPTRELKPQKMKKEIEFLHDLGLNDWKITIPGDGGSGVQTMLVSELLEQYLDKDNLLFVLKFALQVIEDNDLREVKNKENWRIGVSLEEKIAELTK